MRHHKTTEVHSEAVSKLEVSLSGLLKSATAEIHHEIEHGSDINRKIVQKNSDKDYLDTYAQFLLTAYGFESAVLEKLRDFGEQNLAAANYPAEAEDSTDLILDDLAALQIDSDFDSLKSMPGLPEIETIADLAGMEYVRRGSRNGNSYIARVVKNNLNIGADNGASFLNVDGNHVHPKWESFKQWLDSLELAEDEMNRAVSAAVATFKAVGEWHHRQ